MFVCAGCVYLDVQLCTLHLKREAKDTVQHLGEAALGLAGAYYEDHIQPMTDSYAEWASSFKSSVWEKIKTTVDNYMPLTEN